MTKKLFKNSFIYVLGDVLNKAVPFFMLPVLTRYLTPEDYGIISIFGVFVAILAIFTGLSIHGIINVNFFKMSRENLKVFIGNCIIILNISSFVVLLLVFIFHPLIIEQLNISIEWLFVGVVLAFAQFLTTINLLLWTAEQKPKQYSMYQISQTIVVTLLSITFVVGFGMNWEGQLIATSIGTILFSIISFIFIVKRGYLVFQPNKEYMKDALKFGVPLIPHALSGWIQTGADRVLIMSLAGATATGIYAVGYQMAMIMNVLIMAFHKAWTPYLIGILSKNPNEESKIKLVQFTYIYFIVIIIIAFIFSSMGNMLIPLFLGDSFIEASKFVTYFTFLFAFEGMYLMVTNYVFYVKKTYILAYVTFGASVIHIGLLYLFINLNGAIGAAQAGLISSAITFLAVWILSNKVYKMPWRLSKNEK